MRLDDIPRLSLGFLPTPVERLDRLGAELGITLSAKRDDFTGFGGGGNKVRKLEYLMSEAVEHGVSTVITTGGHQSNHARMTAAAARKFGMTAILVLRGDRPGEWQGNLLLDHLLGASVDFLDREAYFDEIGPRMQHHVEATEATGGKAYVIPLGGANALGAMGYVTAVREMAVQFEAEGRRPPDYIAAPVGSGGTLAGLVAGCSIWWPDTRVLGVSVTPTKVPFPERVSEMANAAAEKLEFKHRFGPKDVLVEDGFVGPGYSVPSEAGNAAIKRTARTEGMLLDPVYTGKAMAGVIEMIDSGAIPRGADVLFLHCGGSPALFPFNDQLTADLPT